MTFIILFSVWCIILSSINNRAKTKYFSLISNILDEYLKTASLKLSEKEKEQLENEVKRQLHNEFLLRFYGAIIIAFIFIGIYPIAENLPIWANCVIVALIATLCFIKTLPKEANLPQKLKKMNLGFTCPYCKSKVSYFVTKEFKTDEKQIVKHEKREKSTLLGTKTEEVPVDYLYYKHHIVYECKECHKKDEKIETITEEIK